MTQGQGAAHGMTARDDPQSILRPASQHQEELQAGCIELTHAGQVQIERLTDDRLRQQRCLELTGAVDRQVTDDRQSARSGFNLEFHGSQAMTNLETASNMTLG
jgi:hypothetical protein